ncbi:MULTISPECIES: FeoA family protein [Glaesserella]|uniref:Ferrous iron transport protein A n=1 Tax=Glaesserella australis TaxID=2094024 RepID=A0A328BYQ1_9PAST|nr:MULTISPECIES: FeoA family protein [Glaesserella]AUI65305.1 iron transporter [Glaesserella sp. 15-184]RAL18577.1 ferrous iron transport protein A [Glaesserella australis]
MSMVTLSSLEKNVSATIHDIVSSHVFGEIDSIVSRRLADLGFSKGMLLTMIAKGPLGKGPYVVRLGNRAQFALREPEANKIVCQILER